MKNPYIYTLEIITKLDGATLKSDSTAVKLLKRRILKPIGFQARKLLFNAKYPELVLKKRNQ